jgi:hypothetical protein
LILEADNYYWDATQILKNCRIPTLRKLVMGIVEPLQTVEFEEDSANTFGSPRNSLNVARGKQSIIRKGYSMLIKRYRYSCRSCHTVTSDLTLTPLQLRLHQIERGSF